MNWEELSRLSIDEITQWAETQPWCRAMADCAQDAVWHAEGDVWTHTQSVLSELIALDEWIDLSPHERTVLIFVALFHDIAKPITTTIDPESGRLRSPKHAVRGEHVARSILRDLGCKLSVREEIARLVRFHGRPAFLLERENPAEEIVRLSWLVNHRLLYLFALADTRGRDTDAMSRPEENLHYWKFLAEEMNCFQQPYPFVSDHARFTYFRQQKPDLHYVPHEAFECTVTLMAGLPGCGKDTWLSRHRSDVPIVSLDGVREEFGIEPTDNQGQIVQEGQRRCREYLRSGTSFAFNATNTIRQTREKWIALFANYNARVEIVYLEPHFDVLLRQNKRRDHRVPERVIRKLAEKCEPPTWIECHNLIVSDQSER